jgi:manganese/zinc/iron transport system permease protein
MSTFFAALVLQAGYNTALVSIGATLLGGAAALVGTYVLLRKRSLVSDAISHATLPGLALAFIVMAGITGDGRSVPALMVGAALSAGLGLFLVEWIVRRTRLPEDAAIGAVLSVFFGAGIVLLTVVQTLQSGGQAGLSSYLLGSTAGMLRVEAEIIAVAAALTLVVIILLRRPFTLVCFDQDYAASRGVSVRLTDLAMLGLVLAVTVIGLRIVGLILIVALTIIPPVTARFWTDRSDRMAPIAAAFGGAAAYVGTALSASSAQMPTGAIIVLVAFALFSLSMLLSPVRGVLALALKRRAFDLAVHRRQGLLELARDERILDPQTLKVLRRDSLIRADGVATPEGRHAAAEAQRDEARWELYRRLYPVEAEIYAHHGLQTIAKVLPPDLVADLDRCLGPMLAEPAPR